MTRLPDHRCAKPWAGDHRLQSTIRGGGSAAGDVVAPHRTELVGVGGVDCVGDGLDFRSRHSIVGSLTLFHRLLLSAC